RRWVAAAGRDGVVRLLRADNGELHGSWPVARCSLSSAALDASEQTAAVGTATGEVVLVHVPSGAVLARINAHRDAVTSLAFSGNGLLASGARDRSVRLTRWDGTADRELFTLRSPGP